MPPVVIPIVGAFATALISGATLATAFLLAAVSGVLAGVSMALAPKGMGSAGARQPINRPMRQATPPREIVYGNVRKSGALAGFFSTQKNKYLHMVIMLASHEIDGVDEYIINEESITPDMLSADGTVTSGKFANLIRLRLHKGTDYQTADTALVAEVSEWKNDHRLRGVAYVYVRVKWDQNLFYTGIPSVSAWVRGKKLYDPRTETTIWTSNVPLIIRDYMTNPDTILQTDFIDIDDAYLSDSADISDEFVSTPIQNQAVTAINTTTNILTLNPKNGLMYFQNGDRLHVSSSTMPDGLAVDTDYYAIVIQNQGNPRVQLASTLENAIARVAINITSAGESVTLHKNAEPRYHGGGIIVVGQPANDDLEHLLSGCCGNLVNAGGKWLIRAGAYEEPSITLGEGDLIGAIEVQTKVSRSERMNTVSGRMWSPIVGGHEMTYPDATRSEYVDQDGQILRRDLPLPFTQRPMTAQRIARITLDRSRMDISFKATFSLSAFTLKAGDNFKFTFPLYGWDEKVFEVQEWRMVYTEQGIACAVEARENGQDVYEFEASDASPLDPSLRTDLPQVGILSIVPSFGLDSSSTFSATGDESFKVIASWETHEDASVVSGGMYEVEFKLSLDTTWVSAGKVHGDVTSLEIPQLNPDVLYDIRIRAFNSLGIASPYYAILSFEAGQTILSSRENWEQETIAGRNGQDWETDSLTAEDWES